MIDQTARRLFTLKTLAKTGKLAKTVRWTAALVGLVAFAMPATAADSKEEQLWHLRNLGKAFYENSATQYEAVGEFEKALALAPDSARERINYGLALMRAGQEPEGIVELERAQKQDPTIPHTWFNLGISYKRASRYDEAITQFEKMVELVPTDAIAHYNLAVLYKLKKQNEKAVVHFDKSIELDRNLAGPHFQLSTLYRQLKDVEKAKAAMTKFREIKKRNEYDDVGEDLEWIFYSEIYETIEADPAEGAPSVELKFSAKNVADGLDAGSAGLTVLEANGDGTPDLLAWSKDGIKVYVGGSTATTSGLENLKGVTRVSAADVNNDGLQDIVVLTGDSAKLYTNNNGTFEAASALPAGAYNDAVWLDYDHDKDMDLFLLGAKSARVRNNGEAGFSDDTAGFPFEKGNATAGVALDLIADTQGVELLVSYSDRGSVLYRDMLAGHYVPRSLAALPRGMTHMAATDINNDGSTDAIAAGGSSVVALINNKKEGFDAKNLPSGAKAPIAIGDLENRGFTDVITASGVFRNEGRGNFVAGNRTVTGVATAAADFNSDGKIDVATVSPEGQVSQQVNASAGANKWLTIGLEGVKNMKQAYGAEIEVKAGKRYQKKLYEGYPLHFGLGGYDKVDTVRITWPNGMIQNEPQQDAGQSANYQEAQRLSGSCPMIYTWNGEEFEFITDVLGVAPLGASAGNGEYFPVDHDEYIQIAGDSLVVNEHGYYEVRITEELREIAYMDEIRLIAVDHPSEVDIYTNDKFKAPPFPEFRLFGATERVYPVRAQDHQGKDVLNRLTSLDKVYPDEFKRDYSGVAEMHTMVLDFGKAAANNEAVMIMNGWVDWADGSTFIGASQERSEGLVMPYLQVRDQNGEWQTVIEDMGIPAGKPKTIVVDLTDKFLSASREVRIVTNLCVYWDEIFLSENTAAPTVRLTDLHPEVADLRFRGFAKVVVHPERKQPEYFVYAENRPTSMWNPTRGLYTRFGDVRELVNQIDDRMVIIGSGDELQLLFDADHLPALPEGWERNFLLFVDGWAKDGDANTAHSQTVGPLPYHGMPQYPYSEPHAFPTDDGMQLYLEFYNTRPALRLIRPLHESIQ